ncbi:MAG: reverse transcriptase-like protein [Thermoplasmatota archaeon]
MEEATEVFFHGDAPRSGNPMSIGAVMTRSGEIIDKVGGVVSYPGTHEKAQWEALIQGMYLAAEHGAKRVIMKGDSRTVINYMNGDFPSRDFKEMEYLMLARKVQLNFNQCFFQYVPAENNEVAINLARSSTSMD